LNSGKFSAEKATDSRRFLSVLGYLQVQTKASAFSVHSKKAKRRELRTEVLSAFKNPRNSILCG
jgi:hypothetical protein